MGKRKNTGPQPLDRSKFVFRFHDGQRERGVDAWKTLLAIKSEIPIEIQLSGGQDAEANAKLLASFRKAIGVESWSEENTGGMTDGEVLSLLVEFFEFVDGEKKSTKPEPTSPPSTERVHYG